MALDRFFVPDLSPVDRPKEFGAAHPRLIFVAESPHLSEVEPEALQDRRPLCGAAGRKWWALLSELLEGSESSDVSLDHLLAFCRRHELAVINAVQYPLDPKIAVRHPKADPVRNLGFAKGSGPTSYKKRKASPEMKRAIAELRRRLTDPSMAGARIWVLGNDAEWFVAQALPPEQYASLVDGKIPHPSAWWRSGGLFGRTAREKLTVLLSARPKLLRRSA